MGREAGGGVKGVIVSTAGEGEERMEVEEKIRQGGCGVGVESGCEAFGRHAG